MFNCLHSNENLLLGLLLEKTLYKISYWHIGLDELGFHQCLFPPTVSTGTTSGSLPIINIIF